MVLIISGDMTQCIDISLPMVRMNVLPPSSGLGSNRSNRYEARTAAFFLLVACLAYFDPEDGANMFIRNILKFLPDYTTLHPRRYCSSLTFSEIVYKVEGIVKLIYI